MIFSTYPSILLYQSFGKWKRMSNLPLAMFVGLWNTSKRFFRSKSEKMTFPTVFHRASLGAPVHSDIFECCLFRQQKQHCFKSMWPGTPRGPLGKYVENVIFSLFDLKNHFLAFNGPINIAGGRLDILFHFPNDWYKNIEG